MTPEYGATAAMFYIDDQTLDYLKLTGRTAEQVELVETYAKQAGLWADTLTEADSTPTAAAVRGRRRGAPSRQNLRRGSRRRRH